MYEAPSWLSTGLTCCFGILSAFDAMKSSLFVPSMIYGPEPGLGKESRFMSCGSLTPTLKSHIGVIDLRWNPACSMCLMIIDVSVAFGWKLWPHVKETRKPTCDCFGDYISVKSGCTVYLVIIDYLRLLRFEELLVLILA